MGSLTSRPKVPVYQQPQVVYVTQPVTTSGTGTGSSANTNTPSSTSADTGGAEETGSVKTREESLLTRDRSRYGTVTTSFRGLLNLASGGGQKKTLLGE